VAAVQAGGQVTETAASSSLDRQAEPALRPRGVAAPQLVTRLSDERRLVTVLFANIGGVTALAETLGFDSLRHAIDALYDRLVPCIERYEGRVERRSPESLVALFGAPIAHDNDAEMAIRAAIDLREAIAEFERREATTGLSVHVGIHTGMVIAGALAAEAREYSAIGEPIDAASRLADMADAGEVFLSAETFALVSGVLQAEKVGSAKLRGRADESKSPRK
jgi:class 3 adenylate cyclase